MLSKFKSFMILAVMILPLANQSLAQRVSQEEAISVARNYAVAVRLPVDVSGFDYLISDEDTLARIFRLQPSGFMLVASDRRLSPMLAYSVEGNFNEGAGWENFLPILKFDIAARMQFARTTQFGKENLKKWDELLENNYTLKKDFQQWPPEGWSTTGGWLSTNWTQNSPYNSKCPIDGQTHARSVAGCPATAMAQIVNYNRQIFHTRFMDDDDYYHNFGSNNSYWIDNDFTDFGFPSWDQLNVLLDTLESHYQQAVAVNNADKAALTFACGVAAKQVYSSSISGTYGIDQAYDAFIRFGYFDAQLVYPTDTTLNTQLAENMKIAIPAQLGLVTPDGNAGHNVVVDGYNTDELYHFNFGWGGSQNGWYTMPPTSIYYNLTIIEGVVLNINSTNPPVGLKPESEAGQRPDFKYLAKQQELEIELPAGMNASELSIADLSGKIRFTKSLAGAGSVVKISLPENELQRQICLVRLSTTDGKVFSYKFLR